MTHTDDRITTIFDTDNHYWEASDAFTCHRHPKYADRGLLVKEIDGRMRYVVNGEPHPWVVPGPGDVNPRPRPGALFDYFSGILFGSDWPHAEGLPHPRDFFPTVAGFSLDDQRKIMRDNARELTLAGRGALTASHWRD